MFKPILCLCVCVLGLEWSDLSESFNCLGISSRSCLDWSFSSSQRVCCFLSWWCVLFWCGGGGVVGVIGGGWGSGPKQSELVPFQSRTSASRESCDCHMIQVRQYNHRVTSHWQEVTSLKRAGDSLKSLVLILDIAAMTTQFTSF